MHGYFSCVDEDWRHLGRGCPGEQLREPPISPSIDQEPLGKVETWVADPTVQGHPADTRRIAQYRFGGDQRIVLLLQHELLPQRVMFCADSSRLLRVQTRSSQN